FVVLNISDIHNPTMVGRFDVGFSAKDVYVSENYAYISNYTTGFLIFDVSDPTNPRKIGYYEEEHVNWTEKIYVSNDYVYLTCPSGLKIFDVSDKTYPRLVYSDEIFAKDVQIVGDYAYFVRDSQYMGERGRLKILDVSDPRHPQEIIDYEIPIEPNAICVSGDYAYIVGENNLYIYDVSNPNNIVEKGHISLSRDIRDVKVSGDYAYLAIEGMQLGIVNVSDPNSPEMIIEYALYRDPREIALRGNYAYIATDAGLVIVDVSDPRNPELLNVIETYGACGIYLTKAPVLGTYVYLADGSNGLVIIKISGSIFLPSEILADVDWMNYFRLSSF
ncbi:MAG: hypothetical protein J7L28_02125, partial [Thermotogae bacterium]|nr:hypothetical protein [Thermotogota bacterium]